MVFHKYNKIKLLGSEENKRIFDNPNDEIVIEEKIDGANFRFMINKDNQLIFGSRTQQLNPDKDHKFAKNFMKCIEEIRQKFNELDEEIKEKSKNKIFFGENCIKHTINYDWENMPFFLGFDIMDIPTGNYLGLKNRKKLFDSWNLSQVPLIKVCKVSDINKIDESLVPESKYISLSEKDLKAEGIVLKNYDKQLMAKFVRDKFKENNRKVFGGSKKYAKSDEEYYVLKFCTNARIDKCIFKLIDEGNKLDIKLMGDLVNFVYKDIWEENWNEIAFSKKVLNLNNLKKLVSKRCLEVLKQMMINNTINKDRK